MSGPVKREHRALFAVLAAVLMFLAMPAQAADEDAGDIRIVRTEGTVEVRPAGAAGWVLTRTNQVLSAGWRLRTGPNSRVSLIWSDRSVVSFGPRTEVQILPRPTEKKGEGLNFLKGLMSFFHRDKPGSIRVTTKGASASIEGTEFVMSVGEDAGTELCRLSVIDGTVSFTNQAGSIVVTNGQQAEAEVGVKPRVTAGFIANNVLQWALYYPAVLDLHDLQLSPASRVSLAESLKAYATGDLLTALKAYPKDRTPASDAERIYHSTLLLSVGQVGEAKAELSRLSAGDALDRSHRLAAALRTLIAAVKRERKPSAPDPQLPTEFLAASYYEQSLANGDKSLTAALSLAREAAARSPGFGFAEARVAELELSFGRRQRAQTALLWARSFTPRNAQALALQGFILASENNTTAAIDYFNQALVVDSALGNAWLGRGLCRIRRGDIRGGREDLLIAAATEPQRALLRSYLAKAYAATGQEKQAAHELELAKTLDRADPTVWLYSALINQQNNRINQAIRDLERSQELNDNRALFRSRMKLDQDQAVRSANLASVYRDAGMEEVGRREAARAVTYDYANSSAHLFMSDSFNQLRDPTQFNLRYETVWFNELLLANLLASVGAARLSQTLGRVDDVPLFESDHLGFASSTFGRSDGQIQQLASQYGTLHDTAWAIDMDYQYQDGVRPNNRLEQLGLNATVKQQLSPDDSLLLFVQLQKYHSGDNFQYYYATNENRHYTFTQDPKPILAAGYHHAWSPGVDTLLLAGRLVSKAHFSDQDVEQWRVREGASVRLLSDPFNVSDTSDLEIYSAELNQIVRTRRFTLVGGGLWQGGDVKADDRWIRTPANSAFPIPAAAGSFTEPYRRLEGYAYATVEPLDRFWLTGGLSYDHVEYPRTFWNPPISEGTRTRELLAPKAALVWNPYQPVTVRAIYSRSLGGFSLDQSFRLEPSQLAGFPQAFRTVISESIVGSVAAAEHEVMGLALDLKLKSGTYLGLEIGRIDSKVRRTLGIFRTDANVSPVETGPSTTEEELNYRERSLSVTLNQILGRGLAMGIGYQLTDARLENRLPELALLEPALELDRQSRLHRIRAYLLYNHPSGLFSRVDVNYYRQFNSGYQVSEPGDSFVQLDLRIGYRFARRRAELTLGILNLTDTDYRLSPLTYYSELPRKRVFAGSLNFRF